MSKELITMYKCDRCGKQMDSQYAILTLKRAGETLNKQNFVNQDLCVDCFDEISKFMNTKNSFVYAYDLVCKNGIPENKTITSSLNDKIGTIPTVSPLEKGTYVSGTSIDPLNK